MSAAVEVRPPSVPRRAVRADNAPTDPAGARPPLEVWWLLRRGALLAAVLVAGFLAWLVVLTGLSHARAQAGLERRFRAELATGRAPVNQPIATGAPVALLQIPRIGLHEVVVEGSRATQLATGPGHVRTSSLPGQPGVSAVLGRRTAYGGPFRLLGQLDRGDPVVVTTGQGTNRYRVASTRTFDADDAAAFVADGDALLLVTSDPPLVAGKRLVVVARTEGRVADAGARVAAGPITLNELGLAGETVAASALLVWLELLVVLVCGAIVLSRRWNTRATWLLFSAPLLACTWLVFEQVARLLPATF